MAQPKPAGGRRVNVRKTHPGLYHSIMVVGITEILLAVNFWWYTPTFNPFGLDKTIVAVVFLALGVAQVALLNWAGLRKVRTAQALSIFVTLAWGAGNTQQFFDGRASLQLPLVLAGLGVWQILELIEAPVVVRHPMPKREPDPESEP